MRHQRQGKKFNRDTHQRKALFKSLIQALIKNEVIKTTEPKAKVLKRIFDKMVNKAKQGSLHARRQLLAFLQDKGTVNKLVDELALRFQGIKSGFTRFTRLYQRRGDNAMIVKMELTKRQALIKKEVKKEATDKKAKK